MVRVAVDVPALADQRREFDYLVPDAMDGEVTVGTLVRVPLHGHRVAGWVVADHVDPPTGVRLQRIAKVTGLGPRPTEVALSSWAAWRWAGRRTAFLRTASPLTAVRAVPARPRPPPAAYAVGDAADLASEALAAGEAIVRLSPAADPLPLLRAAVQSFPALVVCPSVAQARGIGRRLVEAGPPVAVVPEAWARAAGGGATVVGARAAAWAPAPDAGAIVVVDAQDRGLGEDRAPAWHAWVVAAERAKRAGIPCVLISPCPTLEQLRWGRLVLPSRRAERDGWAPLEIVDRTVEDPRSGLLSERLATILRAATLSSRVVCVLNRKGRIRLLACKPFGHLTVCEHCEGPMEQRVKGDNLDCRRCHRSRPPVCQVCGSSALRAVRTGVAKVREDTEALARLPVGEVTSDVDEIPTTPIIVGTEAVLHRLVGDVGTVAFLDFDAELLAPRYRAAEDALALLARASRLVGGRETGGRLLVQTRQPGHHVIQAAVRADPDVMVVPELAIRQELNLPPASALAELSGDPDTTGDVAGRLGRILGIEVLGPTDGRWLVRAPDHHVLCDALAAVGRPSGASGAKLRIDVDPDRA